MARVGGLDGKTSRLPSGTGMRMSSEACLKAKGFVRLADAMASRKSLSAREACYRQATVLDPECVKAWHRLGKCQGESGRPEAQLESYRLAVRFSPDDPGAVYALGHLLWTQQRLSELEALVSRYRVRLAREPSVFLLEALAAFARGDLERASRSAIACLAMQPEKHVESKAQWLLGTTLDGQGKYDEAFRCFERMNELRIPTNEPVDNPFLARVARLQRVADSMADGEARPRSPVADPGWIDPIFLCGFPRSGTTLMGAILGSHPELVTREEWGGLRRTTLWMAAQGLNHPEGLGSWPKGTLADIRRVYRDFMRFEPRTRYVDKLPLQMIDLGLIWTLFPRARVVVMVRNPYDACFSCFAQHFQRNDAMWNFLDLQRTAEAYDRVMSLAKVFLERPWGPLRRVHYEAVIHDTERECRSLCEFLDVPWSPEMLRFHEHAREASNVRTPSHRQVVQPIYRRAVERWRNYERFMLPLAPRLDPWCRTFGYPVADSRSEAVRVNEVQP